MKIFNLLLKIGKKCYRVILNCVRNILGIFKIHQGKNYSLYSGERQTATTLSKIRTDHINRYNWAIDKISKYTKDIPLYGADIFCGNGYGSKLISDKLINLKNLLSIDGSKDAIKIASKYYKTEKILFKQKFFPFRLKRNSLNFIISLESIEHIKDDYKLIHLFNQALKQNGLLILSTPNAEKYSRETTYHKFHYRHYLFNNIIDMMKIQGFELLEYAGQDTYVMDKYKRNIDILDKEKMGIKQNYQGQFILYVFSKI